MRCYFYHTDLGQNAVFHNIAIQIALAQHSGRSKHVWAFSETVKKISYTASCMASTPGQNVHLVVPHNHVVVSSSHLASSSSQLVVSSSLSQSVVELSRRVVVSSRRVVESSRRVVFFDLLSRCTITRLFFNSSYYLSTRHVAFQLFVQRSRALFLEKEGT